MNLTEGEGVCVGCVILKHQQEKFEKGKYGMEKLKLEHFHFNLCTLNHYYLVGLHIKLLPKSVAMVAPEWI